MSELCRSRRSEGYGVCDDVEAEVYTAPVPPQRRSPFQRFFRFPLPWVMVVFPRWLMGLFMCLDFLRIPIRETNSSFVSVS